MLGLLGVLKYLSGPASDLERIILPLGMSILCVQQVAILLALVRDETRLPDALSYARHSLFLPQLFAGPIVLPSAWTEPPQSEALWDDYLARGVGAFALGLAKAAILGEEAFRFAQPFLTEASFTSLTIVPALLFLLGMALTAYFFVSGFCDMAFGIGLMIGIKLPAHVDAPFRPGAADKIWSHWSITLHTALRDAALPRTQAGPFRWRVSVTIGLILALSLLWHGDAHTVVGVTAVVGLAGVFWGAAIRLPSALRIIVRALSVGGAAVLTLSLLTIGAVQPWLTALSGLTSGELGLRDVFVHEGQAAWQLFLLGVALVVLPFEPSAHALFDPDADPSKRRVFRWTIPAWSLSPIWISGVLALLVLGIWRAGTLRESIYFGF